GGDQRAEADARRVSPGEPHRRRHRERTGPGDGRAPPVRRGRARQSWDGGAGGGRDLRDDAFAALRAGCRHARAAASRRSETSRRPRDRVVRGGRDPTVRRSREERAMKSFGDLVKQAQKIQKQMSEVQERLANDRYEASAGGGLVKAVVDGKQKLI